MASVTEVLVVGLDVGLHRFQQPHQLALTALTGVP
jgi:hypothetical protein